MLKINAGNGSGDFCDGIARRDFIRIGAMGIGGLTMANLLEAEAQAAAIAQQAIAKRVEAEKRVELEAPAKAQKAELIVQALTRPPPCIPTGALSPPPS